MDVCIQSIECTLYVEKSNININIAKEGVSIFVYFGKKNTKFLFTNIEDVNFECIYLFRMLYCRHWTRILNLEFNSVLFFQGNSLEVFKWKYSLKFSFLEQPIPFAYHPSPSTLITIILHIYNKVSFKFNYIFFSFGNLSFFFYYKISFNHQLDFGRVML